MPKNSIRAPTRLMPCPSHASQPCITLYNYGTRTFWGQGLTVRLSVETQLSSGSYIATRSLSGRSDWSNSLCQSVTSWHEHFSLNSTALEDHPSTKTDARLPARPWREGKVSNRDVTVVISGYTVALAAHRPWSGRGRNDTSRHHRTAVRTNVFIGGAEYRRHGTPPSGATIATSWTPPTTTAMLLMVVRNAVAAAGQTKCRQGLLLTRKLSAYRLVGGGVDWRWRRRDENTTFVSVRIKDGMTGEMTNDGRFLFVAATGIYSGIWVRRWCVMGVSLVGHGWVTGVLYRVLLTQIAMNCSSKRWSI